MKELGYLARHSDGRAMDWLSNGAPSEYLTRKLNEWKARGWTVEEDVDLQAAQNEMRKAGRHGEVP